MENYQIESISKEEKKRVKALAQKKGRNAKQSFLIEGVKPVLEAISLISSTLQIIYIIPTLYSKYSSQLKGINCKIVNERDLSSISNLKNPQGIIAIANYLSIPTKKEGVTLVLDEVQDPGNFGTIIRSADWFGVKEIVCSNTCVDLYNPKTIQATMGAAFRMKITYCNLHKYLEAIDLPIFGAFLEGENVYTSNLPTNVVLVMGNEGNGISKEIEALITHKITIPRVGESESLNVGTATSILLSEFMRNTFL